MPAEAKPVVHLEDDRFKVTEWQFAPGAQTGWHRHGHDYVIVPLTDGTLGLDLPGDQRMEAKLTRHIPYSRREGVEHNVTNAGSDYLAFLEVEVVDDHIDHQRRATMERMMAAFNARDLDGVMACMAKACAFHSAAGPEAEGTRHVGPEAVRAAYAVIFDSFPQAAWTEGAHVVAGETGVSTWRFVGTDKAGSVVDVRGCDVFAFDGDKIALKDSYRKARG